MNYVAGQHNLKIPKRQGDLKHPRGRDNVADHWSRIYPGVYEHAQRERRSRGWLMQTGICTKKGMRRGSWTELGQLMDEQ